MQAAVSLTDFVRNVATERSVSALFTSKVNCKAVPLTSSKKASWSSLRKAFGAPDPHGFCLVTTVYRASFSSNPHGKGLGPQAR